MFLHLAAETVSSNNNVALVCSPPPTKRCVERSVTDLTPARDLDLVNRRGHSEDGQDYWQFKEITTHAKMIPAFSINRFRLVSMFQEKARNDS
jgi:hypothetical protein